MVLTLVEKFLIFSVLVHSRDEEGYGGEPQANSPKISHNLPGEYWLGKTKL